ncbi:MAG: alpha/beta hydrolase fold [Enterovirga sp.]|nr:alpha/beta hydrolase fold [Enterovirga sp.]
MRSITARRFARRLSPLGAAAIAGVAGLASLAVLNARAARRAEQRHPPEGRFIDVDGVAVHYIEAGEGPTLVLLHGNGADVSDFATSGLLERLTRRFRVIALDRPGFGHSERPRATLWTPTAQAALIRDALGRIGITEALVLGHSWGCMVAAALALDPGFRTRGLVLLAGYYFPTARADVVFLSGPAIPGVGDAMRYTLSPPLARLIAPKLFKRIFEPRPVPRRFRHRFPLDMAVRPSQIRASAEDTAFMIPAAAAVQHRYREIACPTLIMTGSGDRIVEPERQSMRLHDAIPGSTLEVFPRTGHMLHYAHAARIGAAVEELADGLSVGEGR